MRRPFRLAFVGLGGAAIGFTAARCGTPTQLIVNVSTTGLDCNRIDTGIFVGKISADTNDSAGPRVSKRGCERPGVIGSAVFLPTGADDEPFAIKIVTAVDTTVTTCVAPGGSKANCIIERRAVRYDPGAIVRVDVSMDQQCLGVQCAPAEKCSLGNCLPCPECVDPSGTDAGPDASEDGGVIDGGVDAPCPPACANQCANGICEIACSTEGCDGGLKCPANRPCSFHCSVKNACDETTKIDCTEATACDVFCDGVATSDDLCHKAVVQCGRGPCRVRCIGINKTCHELQIVESPQTTSLCFDCHGSGVETCHGPITCDASAAKCAKNCEGCKEISSCESCPSSPGAKDCTWP